MRSILPRLFKAMTPKITEKPGMDDLKDSRKTKGLMRFRLLRRKRNDKRGVEGGTELAMTSAPALLKTSSRAIRRPNMATTQRRLAASQRRLRRPNAYLNEKQSCSNEGISRRVTYPSEKPCTPCVEPEITPPSTILRNSSEADAVATISTVRRTKTGSAFLNYTGGEGSRIEVEFTDDSQSMLSPNSCRKSRIPTLEVTPEHRMRNVDTPSQMHKPLAYGEGQMQTGTSENTDGTEWESVTSCEEAETLAGFHRDRMLAKLAALIMQEPPLSQDYTAKRAMRIHPTHDHFALETKFRVKPARMDSAMERRVSCY